VVIVIELGAEAKEGATSLHRGTTTPSIGPKVGASVFALPRGAFLPPVEPHVSEELAVRPNDGRPPATGNKWCWPPAFGCASTLADGGHIGTTNGDGGVTHAADVLNAPPLPVRDG
jgi:hypothetical protein